MTRRPRPRSRPAGTRLERSTALHVAGRRIPCFMIEDTNTGRVELRRYASDSHGKCPGRYGYHNASVPFVDRIGDDEWSETWRNGAVDADMKRELGFPERCECGYAFAAADEWQLFHDSLFRRVGTDELHTLRAAPLGAIWNAPWLSTHRPPGVTTPTADGLYLVVQTPGGYWPIDGPSYNDNSEACGGWTRTGTPPNITVNPSIWFTRTGYHGWLHGGELRDV